MRAGLVFMVLMLTMSHASAQTVDDDEGAEQEARARFQAGRALVESGSFRAARAEFQRGFEYSGRPLFLFNMAECAREVGDRDSARREYSEYLRMDPDGDFAPLATGRLEELGPGDTRTPEFVTGVRTRQRSNAHMERGAELYQEGNFSGALGEFDQAYRLAEDPDILFHMAMAHRELGHAERAVETFERFLSEALPGATNRPEAEARRNELIAARAQVPEALPPVEPPKTGLRSGAIIALSVSGLGLLAMAVSGAMTLSLRSDLDGAGCADTGCDPADVDGLVRRARTFDVSAGLSLAAFATGLTLLLLSRDDTSTGVNLTPSIQRHRAGLALGGTF